MKTSILDNTMATMTWKEIESLGQAGTPVLWPISVLEEHGPHLSIAVDINLVYTLTLKVRDCLAQQGIWAVLAPPNYWGINNVTAAFPGSFTLRKETLKALVYDILACLKRWGFEQVFLIDFHGDVNHRATLLKGVAAARVECGTRAVAVIPYRYARYAGLTGAEEYVLIQPEVAGLVAYDEFTPHQDIHAGALETSFMQRYFPEQASVETAMSLPPTAFQPPDWKKWASGWSDARLVVPDGYNGDPASLKPELAEAFLNSEAVGLARIIECSLKGTYQAPSMEIK